MAMILGCPGRGSDTLDILQNEDDALVVGPAGARVNVERITLARCIDFLLMLHALREDELRLRRGMGQREADQIDQRREGAG